MSLWAQPVRDLRKRAEDERRRLVDLIGSLSSEEWLLPTAAAPWTVKDLALHVLDDDLRWLSHQRDSDESGLIDASDGQSFVDVLAASNQRWVEAAQALSRGVVSDLLAWTGHQLADFHAAVDMQAQGRVSWAGDEPIPFWFNLAQEFTERWVHQQQMREAVGRVDDHLVDLPEVLRTFVWAFPHQYRAAAPEGSQILLSVQEVADWTLTADGNGRWSLAEGAATAPCARLTLSASSAWRLLTGASAPGDQVSVTGPTPLTAPLLRVRGIIV